MSLSEAVLVRPARDRLALAPQALERLVKVWDRNAGSSRVGVHTLACVAVGLNGGDEVGVVNVPHANGEEGKLLRAVVEAAVSFTETETTLREPSQEFALFLCKAEFGRLSPREQAG